MSDYNAPLRDLRFILHEVFNAEKVWAQLPQLQEAVDSETADAILEEAAKVTGQLIAPLSRNGDEQGAQWDNGVVTTPDGFKEAYSTYIEGGWVGYQAIQPTVVWACQKCFQCSLRKCSTPLIQVSPCIRHSPRVRAWPLMPMPAKH